MPRSVSLAALGLFAGPQIAIHAFEQTPVAQPVIAEIVIEGAQRTHPDRIRFRLVSKVGAPLDARSIAEDVRTINTMGPFIDGRSLIEFLPEDRVRLIFTVKELPLVGDVRFVGLNGWDQQGLDRKVTTQTGGHLNPMVLEADRRFLLEEFRNKKWVNAQLTVDQIPHADGSIVDVVFRFDLGYPIEVARTVYEGLPPGAYKFFIDQNLLFNADDRPYDADMLELDGKIVVNQLQDLGYLDASMRDISVAFYDEVKTYEERRRNGPWIAPDRQRNDRASITFTVEARSRYRLGSISFVGNSVVSEEDLRQAVGMDDGEWLLRPKLEAGLEEARNLIRNKGHARAAFRIDRRPDLDERLIHLTVHVFEGGRYRFGRVDIDGNTVTKDAAIRRLMDIYPGAPYNQDAVDNSRRQVARTGLFRNEPGAPLRLDQRYPADRPEEVDMQLDLEEASTGSLNAQIGYSTSSGIQGQLSYEEKNFDLLGLVTEGRFRGAGQTAGISLGYSENQTTLSLNWTNPHAWDSEYFTRTSFKLRFDDDDTINYAEDRLDSSFSVGRYFFDRDVELALGYRYSDFKIKSVGERAADDIREGDFFENALFADQKIDRSNSRTIPTRGWTFSLREAYAGGAMSSSYDYTEITARTHVFVPLVESGMGGTTFLHLRQQNSWLRGMNGDNPPFYQRYRGGGPYPRHRGFDRNELSPGQINDAGYYTRLGGATEWMTSLELSVPVQGRDSGIRLVAFYDYGAIWAEGESIDFDDMRHAAGFGIRFPVGLPVALDFAWLLDPRPGDDNRQVHFSIGNILF